jgi:hypothetical protein
VRAEDGPALEPEQEVLADRLDGEQLPPVELLRDPERPGARMRCGHLESLADEDAELPSGAVDRVALRHAASLEAYDAVGTARDRTSRPCGV